MHKLILLLPFLLLLWQSCGDTTDNGQQQLLIGEWQFSQGSLNGNSEFAAQNYSKYTLSFSQDGKMSSQILSDLGGSETSPYKLEADKIVFDPNKPSLSLKKLTDKELQLFFVLDLDGSEYEVEMSFSKK